MIIAPWGFVVTNTAYALRDPRRRQRGDQRSTPWRSTPRHPDLVRIAVVAGMLGCLLLVPAVLGVFRLAPTSRLVLVGGSLMIAGYVGYFAVLNSSLTTLAMAEHGEPVADVRRGARRQPGRAVGRPGCSCCSSSAT